MDAKLEAKVSRVGSADLVIECTLASRPAALVFAARSVHLVVNKFGASGLTAPYGSVRIGAGEGRRREIWFHCVWVEVFFADASAADHVDNEFARRRAGMSYRGDVSTYDPIPFDRVTTLSELPGHRVVRSIGMVTELASASGFTAEMKGNAALDEAMDTLRRTAGQQGANAIVGLSGSAFGARGGVTSAFGGDAVGVLLIGTAVVVEALDDASRDTA